MLVKWVVKGYIVEECLKAGYRGVKSRGFGDMAYQVLARKWRPQQFDEVVGQKHVTQTLKNAIEADRIAHAYLFVGPRGIGKTSVARIFSKALNCKEGPTATPCDKCDLCKEITAGTCLDVMEIDGASNNGVEQVRDLRETVKYAPTSGAYKIYIIDEVHMLSVAAFNALLKTLEEPPAHVKFVFATTEPEKILPTIISRCQRFDLRRIPVAIIMDRLGQIAKAEKIKVSEDALLAIARGAEGGLRDAESALDQLVSFKGKEISEEDVLSVFGLVSRSVLDEMGNNILAGNIKEVIGLIAQLDEDGKDLLRVLIDLMAHFRNLLICLNVDDVSEGLDISEAQIETLKEQAKTTNTARVLRLTSILSEAESRMKYALCRRTLLETALIRCARAATVVSLEEILVQINDLRTGGGLPEDIKKNISPDSPSLSTDYSEPSDDGHKLPEAVHEDSELQESVPDAKYAAELSDLLKNWHKFTEKVGKIAILARSPLIDACPTAIFADHVVIAFDPEFASELDNFKVARNRKAVEHVLKTILKRDVRADFVVGPVEGVKVTASKLQEREKGSVRPRTGEAPCCPEEGGKKGGDGRTKQEWIAEPAVQGVLDVFSGTIVKIRE